MNTYYTYYMKKSRKIIGLLVLFALLVTLSVSAAEEIRTVTVTGTATVTVEADRASLNLGVRTQAEDAEKASQANAQKVQSVMDALKEAGIPEENITTNYYYVNALYDYSSFTGEDVVKGYQVSNSLTVIVDEIDRAGEMIDIALAAGANSCDGISFQSSASLGAYDEALSGALREGRRKAELIAQATGETLGSLVSVTESYGSYSGMRYAKVEAAMDRASGTAIMADGLDFSATVQMTFSLK